MCNAQSSNMFHVPMVLRIDACRLRQRSFLLFLILIACLLAPHHHILADNSAPSESVNALWMAQSDGVLKIATSDGRLLSEIRGIDEVSATAVDIKYQRVWFYANNVLFLYDFNGTQLRQVTVPLFGKDHDDDDGDDDRQEAELEVEFETGNVWLGVDKYLFHYSADGQLLASRNMQDEVQALAFADAPRALWVATEHQIEILSQEGTFIQKLEFNDEPEIEDIDYDPHSNSFWVVTEEGVSRYSMAGELQYYISIDETEWVAADAQGFAWVATEKRLYRIAENGPILLSLEPFDDEDIKVLAADPSDGSVWVAQGSKVRQYTLQGVPKNAISTSSEVLDLALYADIYIPTLSIDFPEAGALLNSNPPSIEISYSDVGGGINHSSLRLFRDNTQITVSCSVSSETSSLCLPRAAFPEGNNTVSATINDYAGNTSLMDTVNIFIDSLSPAPVVTDNIDIQVISDTHVNIVVGNNSAEPHAEVILTNVRTAETTTGYVQANGSFSVMIAAQSGDELRIQLRDAAGNLSASSVVIVPDSALRVAITSPLTGALLEYNQVTVTGIFIGPINTGITVNGKVADVNSEGYFVVNNLSLAPGSNELVAVATTIEGGIATDRLTLTSNGSPRVLRASISTFSGIAPLTVSFEVEFLSGAGIQRIDVDYDGDGVIDSSMTDITGVPPSFEHTYTASGSYPVSFTLLDADNQIYRTSATILVNSASETRAIHQQLWDGVNQALINGNKESALQYLNESARQKFSPVFDVLLPRMSDIIASYSPLMQVSVSAGIGEYVIARPSAGGDRLFFIYFLRDTDGVWRLDEM